MQGNFHKTFCMKFFYHILYHKQEIEEKDIDKSSAYMLLYEREGLSISDYLPEIDSER